MECRPVRVIQCTNPHGEYRTVYAFRDDDLAYLAFHDSRAHPALRVHIEGITFDGSINATTGYSREEIHGVQRCNISQPIASGNVTHSGWGFELEFYENSRTRIYFEPGYAVEAGDLVVFVPKSFTDLNPGRECSIASSLSISGLEDDDSDRSNSDHGGIVLVDDAGRIYVDVVLHNRQDASDTPMDDAWEDLTPSATYTLCLRKKPPWARRSLDEVELGVNETAHFPEATGLLKHRTQATSLGLSDGRSYSSTALSQFQSAQGEVQGEKPPWARRSLDEVERDSYEVDLAKRRGLQLEWWEQPVSLDQWIYIDDNWIHIVYNCDVEPDPNVVGKEFHAEWLRECNRLNRRQRASRRGNLSAIAFDGTTTERLLGRAE